MKKIFAYIFLCGACVAAGSLFTYNVAESASTPYATSQCIQGQYVAIVVNQSGSSVAITALDKKC